MQVSLGSIPSARYLVQADVIIFLPLLNIKKLHLPIPDCVLLVSVQEFRYGVRANTSWAQALEYWSGRVRFPMPV